MSKVATHVREEGFAAQCAMKETPTSDPIGSMKGLVSEALPYLGETCTQRDGEGNRFHKAVGCTVGGTWSDWTDALKVQPRAQGRKREGGWWREGGKGDGREGCGGVWREGSEGGV
jgi:hypothetical protein